MDEFIVGCLRQSNASGEYCLMNGVMMLINELPEVELGGAERQAEQLAGWMTRKLPCVFVLTRKVGVLKTCEIRDGFVILRIPQYGPGRIKPFTFVLGALVSIIKHRHSIDILHAHLAYSPALVAAVAGKLLGKKVIVKFGNVGAFGDVKFSQRTLLGRLKLAILHKWADAYIALSSEMEHELLDASFLPTKIIRMANGVNIEEFCPPTDKQFEKQIIGLPDKVIVLFTGRLTMQKALNVLLDAFQMALQTNPNLHLVLVGDGDEKDKLGLQSLSLGIQKDVTFTGRVADVRPYLRAADIFTLPSLFEGMSNSLLEAMAMELPCIATRIESSIDLLDDGNCGILVETNNISQLADAIVQLSVDREFARQIGKQARRQVMARYSFSSVAEQYFELYQQLCMRKDERKSTRNAHH
jgi:glycosyltransferase involved in cell wall biosynthesis